MRDWVVVIRSPDGTQQVKIITAGTPEQARLYGQSLGAPGDRALVFGQDTDDVRERLIASKQVDAGDFAGVQHTSVPAGFGTGSSGRGGSGRDDEDGVVDEGGADDEPIDEEVTDEDEPLPLELEDRLAAFLRGAGIGSGRGTIADRFLRRQFNPYKTAFDFGELVSGFGPGGANGERTPEETARAFEDFVAGHSLPDVQRRAAETLAALYGNPTDDPDDVDLADIYSQPDREQASEFANLAMTALQSKISPYALRLMGLPGAEELRSEFLADGGGDGGDFRQFVKNRFGLDIAGIV